ncbi:TPA: hypothetical protein IB161_000461 [Escherichia coli]|nr:hypothetical protein [Escherichia coli]
MVKKSLRQFTLMATATVTLLLGITIKDSGGGFAPEVVDRIFEPFFTTKRRGMGLGLAIVSEIVRNSNGALHASNHPEGGAVMTLTWPEWGEEHE